MLTKKSHADAIAAFLALSPGNLEHIKNKVVAKRKNKKTDALRLEGAFVREMSLFYKIRSSPYADRISTYLYELSEMGYSTDWELDDLIPLYAYNRNTLFSLISELDTLVGPIDFKESKEENNMFPKDEDNKEQVTNRNNKINESALPFLDERIRAVGCVYGNDGTKVYTFKCSIDVNVGDYVLVLNRMTGANYVSSLGEQEVPSCMYTVVRVVSVDEVPDIYAQYNYKWIIAKVDGCLSKKTHELHNAELSMRNTFRTNELRKERERAMEELRTLAGRDIPRLELVEEDKVYNYQDVDKERPEDFAVSDVGPVEDDDEIPY